MTSKLASRIKIPSLHSKICKPSDTIKYFKNGDNVGWSGFTAVNSPKVVPPAVAKYVSDKHLQGKFNVSLYVGASSNSAVEDEWADLKMISKRSPYQVSKSLSNNINTGETKFFDTHVSLWIQNLYTGFYPMGNNNNSNNNNNNNNNNSNNNKLNVSIIEATEITEDGLLILGPAIGAVNEFLSMSDKIIIEINTSMPSFKGIHDITDLALYNNRQPYPITAVDQRIGEIGCKLDLNKIVAIVESNIPNQLDFNSNNNLLDNSSKCIAENILEFFEQEVKMGRLPENLLPLQSGVGNVSNAIIAGLAHAPYKNLNLWTEVLQDSFLPFFDSGKLEFATSTAISLSKNGFDRLFENWDFYKSKIILRSQQISNSPEIIRRLGVIAMNTPVEVDVYGHANSTCVMGSRMLHGIGGSGDFLRNAKYSIMHTPSTRPSKTDPNGISCIVPFSSHIDHTEHDLDIIVTEQGLADLRGLSPRERSRLIVNKTAHPYYRDLLNEYLNRAEFYCEKKKSLHEPHILKDAFKFHINYEDNNTMHFDKW